MSRDPYIDGGGYLDDDGPVSATRTSVLAVSSLATSLLCCIPFLGVISIVLGASSLILIGRSNGRLTGRGAAIAGLIVGIMTAVIWGAVGAGLMQAQRYYITQMVPPAETIFSSVETRDIATFRTTLNHDATNDLNDARIEEFMSAFEREFGGYVGVATDWGTLIDSFKETFSNSQNQQGGGHVQVNNATPVPVGVIGKSKSRVVFMVFDESSLGGTQPYVADVMVLLDGERFFTLREDGPAARLGMVMWGEPRVPLDEVGVPDPPAAAPGSESED